MAVYDIEYTEVLTKGYHGTDAESARRILYDGFKASRNESLRLGDGVYFYELSYLNAFEWAKRSNKQEDITVLVSHIKLGKCLNLTDAAHRSMIKQVANKIKDSVQKSNSHKITDAVVINYMCKLSGVDTVKAAFTSPRAPKLFKGSKLVEYQQIIICVRNLRNILSTSKTAPEV